MKKTCLQIVTVAIALMLSGCMAWKPVSPAPVKSTAGKYSVTLPAGWNVFAIGNKQIVSKYGDVHTLVVNQVKHKNAFGTGKNRTSSTADIDPREFCNKLVADMKALPQLQTMEITAVAPFMLGGRPGFRAELSSKRTFQADGIRYQHVLYGAANENGLYIIHYEAPVLHYFAKDLPEVERAVASFKLL